MWDSSLTATYVKTLNNSAIAICDTRKTTPGLRFLEKAAVKAGGGVNHRFNLSDMILIKENHLAVLEKAGGLTSLTTLIDQAKQRQPNLKAEIEIENIQQLHDLDLSLCDYIMLDNFSIADIPQAASLCRQLYPKAKIEVSGNVSLTTISSYRHLDIDRISVGALTHSVPAFDISLRMESV